MALVGVLSQIKLLFGPLVIQLVWYILKQLFFSVSVKVVDITAPFNNMRTLKFKAQPTNAFFATVNQMFAGPSQLSTAAEQAVIKSLCRVQTTNRVRE